MKVIYTRYGVKEVPETPEEIEEHTRKMRETNPNYIPLQRTVSGKCDCFCHKAPPNTVFHCMPCC